MRNYSRYLFLEFIDTFSLILVGNQGSYDFHLFKLINVIDRHGTNKYKLERQYVYKHNEAGTRILGLSVVQNTDRARIYILTSDRKLNVLEICSKHK